MSKHELPPGYAEMMDKLKDPKGYDVPGLISDVAERVRRDYEDGEVLAVIDTLCFRMKDIAERISHRHAKRINAKTFGEAEAIAASLVPVPVEASPTPGIVP